MKRLILAFQLLTRLPIRRQIDADSRMYASAAVFYPLCGFFVGMISAIAYLLGCLIVPGSAAHVGNGVAALFAVIAMAAVTGGLHLDGLADTFDGLLSSRSPERMLEIMKDSRVGVMGAIVLILDIAARLIITVTLGFGMGMNALAALLIAPCAAKTAIAAAAWVSPYARNDGLGKSVTDQTRLGMVLANLGIALVCCAAVAAGSVFAARWNIFNSPFALTPYLLAPVLALLLGVILSKLIAKRLGGITGDILGAVNEITELSVMLFILAWR